MEISLFPADGNGAIAYFELIMNQNSGQIVGTIMASNGDVAYGLPQEAVDELSPVIREVLTDLNYRQPERLCSNVIEGFQPQIEYQLAS